MALKEESVEAGALIYDTGKVVHTQYLASSEYGKRNGALDLLLRNLIDDVYSDRTYFDFGVSTEDRRFLNEGLFFKGIRCPFNSI